MANELYWRILHEVAHELVCEVMHGAAVLR